MQARWFVVSMSLLGFAARADGAERGSAEKGWFFGLTSGVAYGSVDHPLLSESFAASELGLSGGQRLNGRWSVAFSVASIEKHVYRNSPTDRFSAFVQGAACTTCSVPPSGWTSNIVATFTTAGPRVDFTPYGDVGPFASVSAGLAAIQGIDTNVGVGAAAHLGYRLRVLSIIELAFEAGLRAQRYDGASVTMGGALLSARLHM